MSKKIIVLLIYAIFLSFVGCESSGKHWKTEIDALFADVKTMHSQILDELIKPTRKPGDYEAATKIINQNEAKIKTRFNEIMAASSWEVPNDEKTALREKMLTYPSAAIEAIDNPYLLHIQEGARSEDDIRKAKDEFYRKYASLFSENAKAAQKIEPTNSDIESKLKAKNYPVEFVDRKVVFPLSSSAKPDLLMLAVKIAEDGKLTLNMSEMGTIADPTLLSQEIKKVFEKRENITIAERGVVIDPQGKIKNEDLEKLVETLAAAKASPIRIIKSGT